MWHRRMLVHQEQQSQQVLRWIGVGRGDGGTRSGGLSDYHECPSAYAPEYCSLHSYPECSSADLSIVIVVITMNALVLI